MVYSIAGLSEGTWEIGADEETTTVEVSIE
jgi:hypothetical protein